MTCAAPRHDGGPCGRSALAEEPNGLCLMHAPAKDAAAFHAAFREMLRAALGPAPERLDCTGFVFPALALDGVRLTVPALFAGCQFLGSVTLERVLFAVNP